MGKRISNPKKSYTKAIFLIAVFLSAIFIYEKALPVIRSTMEVIEEGNSDTDTNQRGSFTKTQQDSIRKSIGGFWVLKSSVKKDVFLSGTDDRIEINPNGIIWRVRTDSIPLPSGIVKNITHVYQAYLTPFLEDSFSDFAIISDVNYLKRVWIHNGDTCYVPCNKIIPNFSGHEYIRVGMESWIHRIDNENLIINGKRYSKYVGDLSEFFPKNLIDYVDDIRILECKTSLSKSTMVRDFIYDDIASLKMNQFNVDDVQNISKNLYIPYCFNPIMKSIIASSKLRSNDIKISFDLLSNGSVDNISLDSKIFKGFENKTKNTAIKEIKKWHYPKISLPNGKKRINCFISAEK